MRWLREAGVFLAYVAVALFAALHGGLDKIVVYQPGGQPGELADRTFRWSVADMHGGRPVDPILKYGGSDDESYLFAGEHLAETGSFEVPYMKLWPPGMAIVIAAILLLTGPDSYVLKMVVFNAFVWALALYLCFRIVPVSRRGWINFLAYASILALPALREWTFGFGSLMSEGLSNAFFLIGFVWLVHGVETERRKSFVIAALTMALATYFRIYFKYAAQFIFGFSILVVLVCMLWRVVRGGTSFRNFARSLLPRRRRQSDAAEGPDQRSRRFLTNCMIGFLVFTVALEPWRIYKHARMGQRRLYSATLESQYGLLWLADEEVPGFVTAANPACHADPRLCQLVRANRESMTGEHLRNLALLTLVTHPFEWFADKAKDLDWLWFGRDWEFAFFEEPWLAVEGVLLLVLGLAGVGLLLRELALGHAHPYRAFGILIFSFGLMNVLLFTLLYYEWRYAQPIRVLAFFLPLFVLHLKSGAEVPAPRLTTRPGEA